MYLIKEDSKTVLLEPTSFSKLEMNEHDLEELIKNNPQLIAKDDSLLIVGQQVRNSSNGICDLVGLNQSGDIVLIEIKRDRKDIESRREAFEFQAIRYVAGFATLETLDELVHNIYVPFLERNIENQNEDSLSITVLAMQNLLTFFRKHHISLEDFNQRQQIVLVASDYDSQTVSAVAWLNQNGVEMYCYKLIPFKIKGEIYIQSQKVLPLDVYEDYYVGVVRKGVTQKV